MKNSVLCLLGTIILVVFLSGCGGLEYPRAHKISVTDSHSLSLTSDLRAVHVLKKKGQLWILSEPPPDAAFSYENEEDLNISLVSTGGTSKDGEGMVSGSEDLPLTGRSSYVLLAREMGYRVNEMAFNTNADFEQYYKAYKESLLVLKEIASIEAANLKQSTTVSVTTGATASQSLTETESRSVSDNNASQSEPNAVPPAGSGADDGNDGNDGNDGYDGYDDDDDDDDDDN